MILKTFFVIGISPSDQEGWVRPPEMGFLVVRVAASTPPYGETRKFVHFFDLMRGLDDHGLGRGEGPPSPANRAGRR